MATVLEAPKVSLKEAAVVSRKQWTRTEYRRLIKDGFLQNGKYELVLGEIWEKVGQGRRHIIAVMRIIKALEAAFDYGRLQSQGTLPLGENGDPEPDVAVLAQAIEHYLDQEPTAADTTLVLEVSDSTLIFDLTNKLRQYGSQNIPEYWVVDIPHRLLHIFRQPTADGYADETILTAEDEIRPLAAPETAVRVQDLLPPA